MAQNEEIKLLESLMKKHGESFTTSWSDNKIQAMYSNVGDRGNAVLITLNKWFPKIAAAAAIVLALSTFQIYSEGGSFDTNSIVGMEDITPDEAFDYLAAQITSNE